MGLTLSAAETDTADYRCSEPQKLGPYFYEIAYERYSDKPVMERLEKAADALPKGGCSGLRSGNFHGRNMDWTIDNKNYYLVRVSAAEGRFASLGIAMGYFGDDKALLPWTMMDGVNSEGVVVQVNVVPTGDRGLTVSTNPGAPRLGAMMVVRYLLDRAESAANAVELLRGVDLFGNGKNEMHWMISDYKETIVVEVVNNRLQTVKHPIITNFYLTESPYVKADGAFTQGSAGIERYERLRQHLGKIDSAGAMLAAMKEEWYSLAYAPGNELSWWSEFNDINWTDPDTGRKWHFAYDDGGKENPSGEAFAARMKYIKSTQRRYADRREREQKSGVREDSSFWHSVESGCYDILYRRLFIRMQENEKVYAFCLGR